MPVAYTVLLVIFVLFIVTITRHYFDVELSVFIDLLEVVLEYQFK